MTENEALKILNNECEDISKVQIALKVAREALSEIQQYKAIGTVEEFKALKEKEERFDRNIRMFNEIGLEIRAKAIDEFVRRLKNHPYAQYHLDSYLKESISEIAEQMKAGGIE